jgi:RNA polymerase sigma-70 factor, ECF subfamily
MRELFERHRDRLRQMISVRVDPRTTSRFDASDVIQETLFEASRMLPEYLSKRPLPFYPWLRQIAWQRLSHLQRDHLEAQKRSVKREDGFDLPDRSAMRLAEVVMASGTSPSRHAMREERSVRVRAALARISLSDRELLVLRNLERLSTAETAAVLGISEAAAKTRYFRALARLQHQLGDDFSGE